MRRHVSIFALVLLALSVLVISVLAQTEHPATRWEYKLEYKLNEKKANELGAQGWELAAIESTSNAGIGSNVPTYVFKRRVN